MAKKKKRSDTREPLDEYDEPYQPVEKTRIVSRIEMVYILDQDEVNFLINASTAPYVELERPIPNTGYSTYTEEEAYTLIEGNFYPREPHKKKKK